MAQVMIEPGLFTEPPEPRLVVGTCAHCQEHHFPATDYCPYCASADITASEIGATGTVYLHTIVNTAPPGYEGPVPYGFGLVDLPEGLRVVSRLVAADLQALRSGLAVRLVVEALYEDDDGNEVLSWAYTPAEERST